MTEYKHIQDVVKNPETISHTIENRNHNDKNNSELVKYHKSLSRVDEIFEIISTDDGFIKCKSLQGTKFKLNLVNYSDFNSRVLANDNTTILFIEFDDGFDYNSKISEDFYEKLLRKPTSFNNSYVFIKSLPYCISVNYDSKTNFIDGITYNFMCTTNEAINSVSYSFVAIEETLYNILIGELDFSDVEVLFKTKSNSYERDDDYYFSSLLSSIYLLEYVQKFPNDLDNNFVQYLKRIIDENNIKMARNILLEECENCKI